MKNNMVAIMVRFQRATMVPAVREQAHYNAKQHKRERHIPLHGKE